MLEFEEIMVILIGLTALAFKIAESQKGD